MTELVAVDVGGTHCRFALARVGEGRVTALEAETVLRTSDHASLPAAWAAYAATLDRPLPRAAAIAVAGPVSGAVLRLTNNAWTINRATLRDDLGLDEVKLINDFGAVAHAAAQAEPSLFRHLCGPDAPLPDRGVITVLGPGTGLGVAQVLRQADGYTVIETEGGHIAFAPSDDFEDKLIADLRAAHGRVSAERVVSGPGLSAFYAALGGAPTEDHAALWAAALDESDPLAAVALDHYRRALGGVAGDLALAQGACGVVLAGGLALRLADRLASGFAEHFAAKGRLRDMLTAMPVRIFTHPQPGLAGAAAAFAQEHRA